MITGYSTMGVGRRWGWGLGLRAQPFKKYVTFIAFYFYWLNSQLTWRGGFPPLRPSPRRSPTHAEHETRPGRRFFYTLPHAEHEITPTTVWFHARRLFFTLHTHAEHETTPTVVVNISPTPYHMPNTKQHAHWRCFVVGIFSTPHHMLSTKPHPCCFVFGIFFLPHHIYRTRNHTLVGVISFGDPFLDPRMNFEGCLLNILYIIKLLLYIFNSIYTKPTGPVGHLCPSTGKDDFFFLDLLGLFHTYN
jgi:hypothetical protein